MRKLYFLFIPWTLVWILIGWQFDQWVAEDKVVTNITATDKGLDMFEEMILTVSSSSPVKISESKSAKPLFLVGPDGMKIEFGDVFTDEGGKYMLRIKPEEAFLPPGQWTVDCGRAIDCWVSLKLAPSGQKYSVALSSIGKKWWFNHFVGVGIPLVCYGVLSLLILMLLIRKRG
jgi:hypothetical protein